MMERNTVFSPCQKYRYTLWRMWSLDPYGAIQVPCKLFVQFLALNPSTATETVDDPTVRRCIGFAKLWGFSTMCMTNVFAFRATDPRVMKAEDNPVGLENNDWICRVAMEAAMVVCCWGNHGEYMERSKEVLNRFRKLNIRKLHHLGLTEQGEPRHPLYLSKTTMPTPWEL